MSPPLSESPVEVFCTCPQSSAVPQEAFLKQVRDVARWSEEAGLKGILVYTDNSLVDPWLLSQVIIQSTRRLSPLVAVQPVYMHPFTVAKMVSSLAHLHGRRIYLNMVAGGFRNDLLGLDDPTEHDLRYDRLVEYTALVKKLLSTSLAVSHRGEFYNVDKVKLIPPLPPELFPGIFVSGSSEAGRAAARALDAVAVHYPGPPDEYGSAPAANGLRSGIRVGIIAREHEEGAWRVAHQRFPVDRKGEITHELAMKTSDSSWHHQLSNNPARAEASAYWLVPFQNYKTFCPYLVGSYQRVAGELARYMGAGQKTFILDIPPDENELRHIGRVFEEALSRTPP